jgi:GNAT superfamily N-acetyltransferase/2'-5' RNA ligase
MVALVATGPVATEIDGLRRALGARALLRIAPHVTVVPPLNVREEDLEDVLDHVRAAARTSAPITLELGPPATFSPRAPVLYLAVGGDLEVLGALRDELVAGPLAPPPGREERDFVPHLTLDQRIGPGRLGHALEALADYRAHHCFERVTVLEQDDEHRWRPLADAALGRPMVVGRGSFDVELSVVSQPDPVVAAWAEELWEAYSRQRYGPKVHPFERYAVIARVKGRPVGYAEGDIRGSALKLGRLVVSPEWRGHGIGSHLLRAVERFAIERGCELVRLETLAGEGAERLYSERGFKVVARLPRWRDGCDFVLMERVLSPAGTSQEGRGAVPESGP